MFADILQTKNTKYGRVQIEMWSKTMVFVIGRFESTPIRRNKRITASPCKL